MFKHKVDWYKIARKCKACGGTKFYWDKERNYRNTHERPDETCHCDSPVYPHPHRPGARFCQRNPLVEYNLRTQWMKEDPLEVQADMILGDRWPCVVQEVGNEPPF